MDLVPSFRGFLLDLVGAQFPIELVEPASLVQFLNPCLLNWSRLTAVGRFMETLVKLWTSSKDKCFFFFFCGRVLVLV